jgi:hypothetical protein
MELKADRDQKANELEIALAIIADLTFDRNQLKVRVRKEEKKSAALTIDKNKLTASLRETREASQQERAKYEKVIEQLKGRKAEATPTKSPRGQNTKKRVSLGMCSNRNEANI